MVPEEMSPNGKILLGLGPRTPGRMTAPEASHHVSREGQHGSIPELGGGDSRLWTFPNGNARARRAGRRCAVEAASIAVSGE